MFCGCLTDLIQRYTWLLQSPFISVGGRAVSPLLIPLWSLSTSLAFTAEKSQRVSPDYVLNVVLSAFIGQQWGFYTVRLWCLLITDRNLPHTNTAVIRKLTLEDKRFAALMQCNAINRGNHCPKTSSTDSAVSLSLYCLERVLQTATPTKNRFNHH